MDSNNRLATTRGRKQVMASYESIDEAVLAQLDTRAKMILGFLHEPSVREISRALNMPKSSVHRAILRLREAGLATGTWSVEA